VTGYTAKYYTWRYWLTTKAVRCYIPNYLLCRSQHADELAGIPRSGFFFPYTGYWQVINWPEDDAFLRDLADAINSGLTDYYEIATNTLHFVEALMPYTPDPEERDFWQTPTETLYLQTGDCEDGAILYVALLRALGYPVYFGVYVKLSGKGHVFAWVEVAKSWVDWCESRPNKCRDLLGCWTIAVVNGKYYAMAETTVDPSIESRGYWGLGCGYIPPDAQSYIIFPPGEGMTAQPATILSCPCSN
jgi:transglutaminase-like putative cysteine protease